MVFKIKIIAERIKTNSVFLHIGYISASPGGVKFMKIPVI